MAKQIRVFDDVLKRWDWVVLDGEISDNGELILNKPLCMKSSESSDIKKISVDDTNSITAATKA